MYGIWCAWDMNRYYSELFSISHLLLYDILIRLFNHFICNFNISVINKILWCASIYFYFIYSIRHQMFPEMFFFWFCFCNWYVKLRVVDTCNHHPLWIKFLYIILMNACFQVVPEELDIHVNLSFRSVGIFVWTWE